MKCPNCAASPPPGSAFCNSCGARLLRTPEGKPGKWIAVVAGAVLFTGVLGVVLASGVLDPVLLEPNEEAIARAKGSLPAGGGAASGPSAPPTAASAPSNSPPASGPAPAQDALAQFKARLPDASPAELSQALAAQNIAPGASLSEAQLDTLRAAILAQRGPSAPSDSLAALRERGILAAPGEGFSVSFDANQTGASVTLDSGEVLGPAPLSLAFAKPQKVIVRHPFYADTCAFQVSERVAGETLKCILKQEKSVVIEETPPAPVAPASGPVLAPTPPPKPPSSGPSTPKTAPKPAPAAPKPAPVAPKPAPKPKPPSSGPSR